MFFISSKKLFLFLRCTDFCFSVFLSFSPCHPLLQRLIKDKVLIMLSINNFFIISTLIVKKADLNVLFQSLFSFKTFLMRFFKQTLAVTLLFQRTFFQLTGIRLSKLQLSHFYFSGIFSQQQELTIWYDRFIFLYDFFDMLLDQY